MPISEYDKYFGGERGSAAKALRSMKETYGPKEGQHVFYARVAKIKRKGRSKRKVRR